MPISKYYGGHGEEVMHGMKKAHGEKAGEREFYATANARGQKPAEDEEFRVRMHHALDCMLDHAGYVGDGAGFLGLAAGDPGHPEKDK